MKGHEPIAAPYHGGQNIFSHLPPFGRFGDPSPLRSGCGPPFPPVTGLLKTKEV
jgi:hypothetical protein